MNALSSESEKILATCTPGLQRWAHELIKYVDFSVVCGHRDKAAQDAAVAAGNSKLKWPSGNHNSLPSRAIDIIPYVEELGPVARRMVGTDQQVASLAAAYKVSKARATAIFCAHYAVLYGAGLVCAEKVGIKIRWGGNWDRDQNLYDNVGKLEDLPHFEEDV